ncbi:hypothetical protein BC828DRAFT_375248 [Blastocladiella britannica]|nr:hypothetical protein BC828DRAFT_375248 [Blastocladiella britannica]
MDGFSSLRHPFALGAATAASVTAAASDQHQQQQQLPPPTSPIDLHALAISPDHHQYQQYQQQHQPNAAPVPMGPFSGPPQLYAAPQDQSYSTGGSFPPTSTWGMPQQQPNPVTTTTTSASIATAMATSLPASPPTTSDTSLDLNGGARLSKACVSCQRRKKRCDGKQPCDRCVSFNLECVFVAEKKRGPKKTGPARSQAQSNPGSAADSPSLATLAPGVAGALSDFSEFQSNVTTDQAHHAVLSPPIQIPPTEASLDMPDADMTGNSRKRARHGAKAKGSPLYVADSASGAIAPLHTTTSSSRAGGSSATTGQPEAHTMVDARNAASSAAAHAAAATASGATLTDRSRRSTTPPVASVGPAPRPYKFPGQDISNPDVRQRDSPNAHVSAQLALARLDEVAAVAQTGRGTDGWLNVHLQTFFAHFYPLVPVFTEQEFRAELEQGKIPPYLLYALCSVTSLFLLVPGSGSSVPSPSTERASGASVRPREADASASDASVDTAAAAPRPDALAERAHVLLMPRITQLGGMLGIHEVMTLGLLAMQFYLSNNMAAAYMMAAQAAQAITNILNRDHLVGGIKTPGVVSGKFPSAGAGGSSEALPAVQHSDEIISRGFWAAYALDRLAAVLNTAGPVCASPQLSLEGIEVLPPQPSFPQPPGGAPLNMSTAHSGYLGAITLLCRIEVWIRDEWRRQQRLARSRPDEPLGGVTPGGPSSPPPLLAGSAGSLAAMGTASPMPLQGVSSMGDTLLSLHRAARAWREAAPGWHAIDVADAAWASRIINQVPREGAFWWLFGNWVFLNAAMYVETCPRERWHMVRIVTSVAPVHSSPPLSWIMRVVAEFALSLITDGHVAPAPVCTCTAMTREPDALAGGNVEREYPSIEAVISWFEGAIMRVRRDFWVVADDLLRIEAIVKQLRTIAASRSPVPKSTRSQAATATPSAVASPQPIPQPVPQGYKPSPPVYSYATSSTPSAHMSTSPFDGMIGYNGAHVPPQMPMAAPMSHPYYAAPPPGPQLISGFAPPLPPPPPMAGGAETLHFGGISLPAAFQSYAARPDVKDLLRGAGGAGALDVLQSLLQQSQPPQHQQQHHQQQHQQHQQQQHVMHGIAPGQGGYSETPFMPAMGMQAYPQQHQQQQQHPQQQQHYQVYPQGSYMPPPPPPPPLPYPAASSASASTSSSQHMPPASSWGSSPGAHLAYGLSNPAAVVPAPFPNESAYQSMHASSTHASSSQAPPGSHGGAATSSSSTATGPAAPGSEFEAMLQSFGGSGSR